MKQMPLDSASHTRSQRIQRLQERASKSVANDDENVIVKKNTDISPTYGGNLKMAGKEGRMMRAKEYLDQVVKAQQSRQRQNPFDNKSILTHDDLVEIQDKMDAKSQVKA